MVSVFICETGALTFEKSTVGERWALQVDHLQSDIVGISARRWFGAMSFLGRSRLVERNVVRCLDVDFFDLGQASSWRFGHTTRISEV